MKVLDVQRDSSSCQTLILTTYRIEDIIHFVVAGSSSLLTGRRGLGSKFNHSMSRSSSGVTNVKPNLLTRLFENKEANKKQLLILHCHRTIHHATSALATNAPRAILTHNTTTHLFLSTITVQSKRNRLKINRVNRQGVGLHKP